MVSEPLVHRWLGLIAGVPIGALLAVAWLLPLPASVTTFLWCKQPVHVHVQSGFKRMDFDPYLLTPEQALKIKDLVRGSRLDVREIELAVPGTEFYEMFGPCEQDESFVGVRNGRPR